MVHTVCNKSCGGPLQHILCCYHPLNPRKRIHMYIYCTTHTHTHTCSETLITPEQFAELLCDDLELPSGPFVPAISSSIRQQCEQFSTDMIPEDEEDRRVIVKVGENTYSSTRSITTCTIHACMCNASQDICRKVSVHACRSIISLHLVGLLFLIWIRAYPFLTQIVVSQIARQFF